MPVRRGPIILSAVATAIVIAVAVALGCRCQSSAASRPKFVGSSQTAAQSDAWKLLMNFAEQASTGQESHDLIAAGWQSMCQILNQSGCEPSAISVHLFHRSPLVLRNQDLFEVTTRGRHRVALGQLAPAPGPTDVVLEGGIFYNSKAAGCVKQLLGIHVGIQCTGSGKDTFPEGSMVLRPQWGILKADTGAVQVYLPGETPINPHEPSATDIAHWWPSPLDLKATDCPATIQNRSSIPIACFYTVTVTGQNLPFYQTGEETLDIGDKLILLGFHLIGKQPNDNWVWSTFGWQGKTWPPSPLKYSCDDANACPPSAEFWAHYKMDTVVLPASLTQEIPAVFNPYLDAGLVNNINLNCVVCHSLAGYPDGGNQHEGTAGLITGADLDSLIQQYASGAGFTKTDFVWSVAIYNSHTSLK